MTTAARCHDPRCLDGPPEGDDPRPRWADDYGLLCARCATLLADRLTNLPGQTAALRDVLAGRRGSQGGWARPTKGEPPVPLNLDAHDHLSAVNAVLTSWVRLVCEERDLRGPDRTDTVVLTSWLTSQMDWLLTHPAVGDLADEVRDLAVTADGITEPTRRPVVMNTDCPACDGRVVRVVVDGLERDQVRCGDCRTTWTDGQWLWAIKAAAWEASRVELDGDWWATPASLADDLGRSERTIRSWQQRRHVRSRWVGGMMFVHVADVQARHEPTEMTA